MHVAAMLVLLHGPEEQRLSTARFFPSLPDVLLLLLVLNQMLAFVLDEQHAPIVKLGEEIGVKRARGSWPPEILLPLASTPLRDVHKEHPSQVSTEAVETPGK